MKYLTLCLAAGLILTVSASAEAITYDIEKEINLYGNLNQNIVPIWGNVACAPTAAVNSFVYLQNKYPGVYDNKLVPAQGQDLDGDGDVDQTDHMIAVVQTLGGANYMNTVANNGTFSDDFIYGKSKYIEEKVPGWTIYEAQSKWAWQRPPIPKPNWVQTIDPTWEFLYGELVDCEDVAGQ